MFVYPGVTRLTALVISIAINLAERIYAMVISGADLGERD